MTVVVADTSVLVAATDTRDRNHQRCVAIVRAHQRGGIVVPVTVAVEFDYLVRARVGAHAARAFLRDVNTGRFLLEPVDAELFATAAELDTRFAALDVGLVDGTVVAVADRWSAAAILSLDDHYRVIAPNITLLPD